jgi:putative DNA primase/helicase
MFRRYYRLPASTANYPSAREIAARLKGDTRRDGSGNYSCHCPGPMHANGDANPSLSVKDGANGRLLLHCFLGCAYSDIVAALERRGILPRRGQ